MADVMMARDREESMVYSIGRVGILMRTKYAWILTMDRVAA